MRRWRCCWSGLGAEARPGFSPCCSHTTHSLEGRSIRRHLGLVHGETNLGANLIRDLLASIRDLIGGRAPPPPPG